MSGVWLDPAQAGVEFATPDNQNRLSILAGLENNECHTIHWRIIIDGVEKQNEMVALEKPVQGPFILRVQVRRISAPSPARMARVKYPGLGSWTYGALYRYHGYPKNGQRGTYEYSTKVKK